AVLAGGCLDRAHELLVLALRVVDEGHTGLDDLGEPGDLPRTIHPEFDDGRAVLLAQAEDGQRHADFIVEVARSRQALLAADRLREDGREHLLHRGLAVAAGDRDHQRVEPAPPATGKLAERAAGIGHAQGRHPKSGDGALDHDRRGATLAGLGREIMRIEALAAQCDEQLAGAKRPRIGTHALDPLIATAVQHADVEPVERFAQGEGAHPRPSLSRSAAAATSTSEKACRRPSISCHCSWPLPAINTTSAGSAAAMASRIAVARSSSISQGSFASPARIASAIACGDSERGLSLVSTT